MSSKHKHSGKRHAAQKVEDRLRRDTPFLCSLKFRNGLPEVPCDPKMLISPLDTEGIAKFQLTTLEQQMRQDLPLDGASGIQISMLDIESYAVPENPPPMHPDDKALLMGFNSAAEERKGPTAARERLRGEQSELNWLMRTSYIAHDAPGKAKQRDAAALSNGAADEAGSRQELLKDIEAGFAAAERPPTHSRDPSLTPVEILPVLPAMEHWDDQFAHVKLDGDPTEDIFMLAGLSENKKQRAAEHALLKSYNLNREAGVIKLLALLLPRDGKVPEDPEDLPSSSTGLESSEREDVYDMVREYDYRIVPHQEHEQSFWFAFSKDAVTYGKMQNRIQAQRNSKVKAMPGYQRPSEVRLKRKPETAEQREGKLKRQVTEVQA
ncbi:g416 [Coccomyxa viridis]|uniref:G416 protein n=1 Tax=Coccomyxa viridis TaxID=1274662 RepID=A0ABP1FFM6_9CHLO